MASISRAMPEVEVSEEGVALTPRSIRALGVGQFLFAALFVVWLLFLPDGGPTFAWPVTPRLTAVFIGTSFILRAFLGLSIIRERYWYRLRWVVWGNYTFLAIILLATFWHVAEMNWTTNIVLAHVWILIYIFEPLILPFLGPFGEAASAPLPDHLRKGPILPGLRRVFVAMVMLGITLGGLFVISPEFMTTRWPWPLDPFNARVMAAWPSAVAVWAGTMYFAEDWAEIKLAMQGLLLYGIALFGAYVITFSQFDRSRHNVFTYGIVVLVAALLVLYYYWRHETRAREGGS